MSPAFQITTQGYRLNTLRRKASHARLFILVIVIKMRISPSVEVELGWQGIAGNRRRFIDAARDYLLSCCMRRERRLHYALDDAIARHSWRCVPPQKLQKWRRHIAQRLKTDEEIQPQLLHFIWDLTETFVCQRVIVAGTS